MEEEEWGRRLGGGAAVSRAVWSRQGQTVARHPEELPLCRCTATGCNLLLRDKTKLTRPFSGDLAASLGQQHAPAPTGNTSEASSALQNRLMVIIRHGDT